MRDIKFTFGIIVLNGEPFIRYNLRALYPFAHEIIVVEGANRHSTHCATEDGHSTDRTMTILREFREKEDFENKLTIVTAEDEGHPNGFWPGEKDEQSQAYSIRATGNWLWQVDVDEFYMESAVRGIMKLIDADPSISTMSFPEIPFWGSFDFRLRGIALSLGYSEVHRLFRWAPGYKYVTHRPVTVVNDSGTDLRQLNWIRADRLIGQGIYMYHYSQIFHGQVKAKMTYYANRIDETRATKPIIVKGEEYYDGVFLKLKKPFRLHTVNAWPSWVERFDGAHPGQIDELRKDIAIGDVVVATRNMDDVEQLVASFRYRMGIQFWKVWGNYVSQLNRISRRLLRRRVGFLEFTQTFFHIVIGTKRLF